MNKTQSTVLLVIGGALVLLGFLMGFVPGGQCGSLFVNECRLFASPTRGNAIPIVLMAMFVMAGGTCVLLSQLLKHK